MILVLVPWPLNFSLFVCSVAWDPAAGDTEARSRSRSLTDVVSRLRELVSPPAAEAGASPSGFTCWYELYFENFFLQTIDIYPIISYIRSATSRRPIVRQHALHVGQIRVHSVLEVAVFDCGAVLHVKLGNPLNKQRRKR